MRAGGHRLRAGIAAAGIAAAGHGLRAGTLPGRAAHIGRPSACPLRHRCSRFPDAPSSCPASKGRAVVARWSSTRSMGGPRSLRRVGSLRAFVLSSSKVPSWVVARPLVVGSMLVTFRRRFKIRPFGPSRPLAASGPPQAGGLRRRQNGGAAEGMTHDAPTTAPPGAHCYAYAPNDARPAADFPECAPWGHTPRNLTLFAHQPPTAAASGAEAVPVGSGCASSHPPALPCAGRGARGHDSAAAGIRCVGWVVGAGARRAGRPGSRRGRKAPGRLPGRLLLWASAPPRLTSCRRCGKMLHEGSHRRRSQRRPSSMVRQKPGRFRNDRALLYPGHHPRDYRRIKAPNATKPRYFVAFTRPKQILSSSTVVWSVNALPYLAVGSRPSSNLKQCLIGCFRPCACRYDILEAQKLQRRKFYERGSQCVFSDF